MHVLLKSFSVRGRLPLSFLGSACISLCFTLFSSAHLGKTLRKRSWRRPERAQLAAQVYRWCMHRFGGGRTFRCSQLRRAPRNASLELGPSNGETECERHLDRDALAISQSSLQTGAKRKEPSVGWIGVQGNGLLCDAHASVGNSQALTPRPLFSTPAIRLRNPLWYHAIG